MQHPMVQTVPFIKVGWVVEEGWGGRTQMGEGRGKGEWGLSVDGKMD